MSTSRDTREGVGAANFANKPDELPQAWRNSSLEYPVDQTRSVECRDTHRIFRGRPRFDDGTPSRFARQPRSEHIQLDAARKGPAAQEDLIRSRSKQGDRIKSLSHGRPPQFGVQREPFLHAHIRTRRNATEPDYFARREVIARRFVGQFIEARIVFPLLTISK
jgi:hypothetical protein